MRLAQITRIDPLAAPSELWDREYATLQVIPSSTRPTPSKALLLFAEILRFDQVGDVLEVGGGNGRNAVYLAQKGCRVHALDFSGVAIREIRNAAVRAGVEDKIHLHEWNVFEGLPFPDESFDLVVDSYVFCHFTDEAVKRSYRRELRRVVRPSGKVFCSVVLINDEYYASLIRESGAPTPIVVDPRNGITKQLYTPEAISDFFSEDFTIFYRATLEFEDTVQERPYWRSVFALVLENRAAAD